MPTYKRGERIGAYQLAEYVDSGGNGEVWKTSAADGQTVIKILKNHGSDRVQRFRDEVAVHAQLGQRRGILPVLDSAVPKKPTRDTPAWLTMPEALPLDRALGENPSLDTVVTVIGRIAETMADLHGENISHRDIKPGNLFFYNSDWVIGDFGLVSFPAKAAVTESGRKLGPANFLAPEMLLHPDTALGPPADVFSLAKTLWALAAGFRFPLPGHLSAAEPEASLSKWMTGFETRPLDLLIDRATRLGPGDRCTMAEFSAELKAWLRPPVKKADAADLSHLASKARVLSEPHLTKEARIAAGVQEAKRLQKTIFDALRALETTLATAGLGTRRGDGWGWWKDLVDSGARQAWIDDGTCQGMINVITGRVPVYMASGVTYRLTLDGQVELGGGHSIYYDGAPASQFVPHRVQTMLLPVGSALATKRVTEIAGELVESSGAAVEELLGLMERWNGS